MPPTTSVAIAARFAVSLTRPSFPEAVRSRL